jgi:DNA-binding MarR family transcriptional regulator
MSRRGDGGNPSGPARPGTVAELLLAGNDLGHLLERMVRRQADLSLVQFNALRVLKGREPAPAQASDLTRSLRVSSAHATTLLQQLQVRGLIERAESSADRRRRPVRLTAAGESVLASAMPALVDLEERLATALGEAQVSGLWNDLRAVRLAVREALAADDLDCIGP